MKLTRDTGTLNTRDAIRVKRNEENDQRATFDSDFKEAIEEAEDKQKKTMEKYNERVEELQKKQDSGESVSRSDIVARMPASLHIKMRELDALTTRVREDVETMRLRVAEEERAAGLR